MDSENLQKKHCACSREYMQNKNCIHQKDFEKIERIVRTAGDFMRTASCEIKAEKGSSANYTTVCDLKIDQYLGEHLPEIFPGSKVFSEENNSVWNPDGIQWIVDPLDGTANFRHRFGASVISVALMVEKKIVLGMIYDAENNRFFSAVRGEGSFLNGKRVKVSSEPPERSLAFVQMGVYRKENAHIHVQSILQIFHNCEDVRSLGSSALELAMLGAGKAELFFAPRLYPWDYAAASLIIQEAGGMIGTLSDDGLFSGNPCSVWAANSAENRDHLLKAIRRTE